MSEKNWFIEPMKCEVSQESIREKGDSGEFHEWNYQAFEDTENGYEDVLDKLKQYSAKQYLDYEEGMKQAEESGNKVLADEYKGKMEKMVDEVYQIYRSKDIYPTLYFSENGIMREVERCIAYKSFWDGDTVSCGAGVGTTLCKFLFPNLQDTPSKHDLDKKGAESIFAKFHNEQYLKRAIKFCFSYKNGCPVPTSVEGGLRLVGSAPSNFRPMNAKAVYERFCPEEGTIYDFCCVSGNTEFFDGTKWKKISYYEEGDKVLQYCDNGTAELVYPTEYIKYKSKAPFYKYISEMFASCLTGNHDVVYKNNGRLEKIKQDEICTTPWNYDIPVTFRYDGDLDYPENEFVFAMLCYMRGELSKEKGKLLINYSLDEYNSVVDIALDAGIRSFETIVDDSRTGGYIKLVTPEWVFKYFDVKDREFCLSPRIHNSWFNLSRKLKWVFTNMMLDWKEDSEPVVVQRDFVDLVQFIFTCCDYSVVSSVYLGEGKIRLIFSNEPARYDCVNNYEIVELEHKYCFVVPSHMLVLRYMGKIFITGNCGFGGRMLGALSSKKNFKYVGTDPNTETMYHLNQLGEYIEMVTGREDSYELHCCGSEDFKGKPNSIDFAFSSPPYFDLEVYSDEPTQCYNKFPNLEDWLEGYVRQTIKNIGYMLKPGRCYAVNIADFKVGSGGECAYVDEWIRLSTEEGMPLFDTVYLGVTARAGSNEQAAGELKKENILIFKKPL